MKRLVLFNQLILLLFMGLFISACVDDDIDINKVSNNMSLSSSLAAPLGEADFNIEKLLGNFKAKDSNFTIKTDNSVLTIFYKDTIEYVNPTDFAISGAACLSKVVTGSDFTNPIIGNQNLTIPTTFNAHKEFHITKIDDDKESNIDSVYFEYSKIKVSLATNINLTGGSSIEVKIKLKDATTGDTTKIVTISTIDGAKEIDLSNFEVSTTSKDSTYAVPMEIKFIPTTGNPISVSSTDSLNLKFEPFDISNDANGKPKSKYIAFGNFKYSKVYQPGYEKVFNNLKLYDYLPKGTMIRPIDPSITINFKSNIGIPLNLNIDSLQTEDGINIKKATFSNGNQFKINRATLNDTLANTQIVFNQKPENGNIDDLFSIKLNKALFNINFTRDSVSPITSRQFIRSDSKVKADVTIAIPVWLEVGSILAYSDTLDFKMDDLLNNDAVTNAVVKLTNTNRLPLGMKVIFKILDENKNIIPSANQYLYKIDPATVNSEGEVLKETSSSFCITYNEASIADLRKAKYILLEVQGNGANDNSRIKIKAQNGLKIKVGCYANKGINL